MEVDEQHPKEDRVQEIHVHHPTGIVGRIVAMDDHLIYMAKPRRQMKRARTRLSSPSKTPHCGILNKAAQQSP